MLSISTKEDGEYAEALQEVSVNGITHDVRNVMTCDRSCSRPVRKANGLNGITVNGSNYAVVHIIDGYLMPEKPDFSSPARLRNYIERFKIR